MTVVCVKSFMVSSDYISVLVMLFFTSFFFFTDMFLLFRFGFCRTCSLANVLDLLSTNDIYASITLINILAFLVNLIIFRIPF